MHWNLTTSLMLKNIFWIALRFGISYETWIQNTVAKDFLDKYNFFLIFITVWHRIYFPFPYNLCRIYA